MPDQPTDPRPDLPDGDSYTPEEVNALLASAMDEYYALCPAEPMTPARLDEMVETMRRNARSGTGVAGSHPNRTG